MKIVFDFFCFWLNLSIFWIKVYSISLLWPEGIMRWHSWLSLMEAQTFTACERVSQPTAMYKNRSIQSNKRAHHWWTYIIDINCNNCNKEEDTWYLFIGYPMQFIIVYFTLITAFTDLKLWFRWASSYK